MIARTVLKEIRYGAQVPDVRVVEAILTNHVSQNEVQTSEQRAEFVIFVHVGRWMYG